MSVGGRYLKVINPLFSLLLLVGASFLILTRNTSIADQIYNADQLYFETIYQGFVLGHEPIHHFILMACPDFIQCILYFACRLFLNMPHALIAAALLSLYLFYFLFLQIVKSMSPEPATFKLVQAVALLGITLLAWPHFWPMDSFNQSLAFQDHFVNSAVMNLLALWFVIHILFGVKNRFFLFLGLFVTVLFTSMSDPVFLSCFVCPALISLVFAYFYMKNLRKWILLSMGVILIAGFGGYFLLLHLPFFGFNISYDHLIDLRTRPILLMLKQVLRGMILFINQNTVLFLIWMVSLGCLFKIKHPYPATRFIQVFILSLVITSLSALVLLDPDIEANSSAWQLHTSFFTHCSPAVYFPIFFMSVLLIPDRLSRGMQAQLASVAKVLILALQISLFCMVPQQVSLAYLFGPPAQNWPWLQCVQAIQKKYPLHQGIADYWISRPFILYAHVPMEQINQDLNPSYWMTDTESMRATHADFVVTDGLYLFTNEVIARYGQPTAIIDCPFNRFMQMQVLIYPQGIPISRVQEWGSRRSS